ncbi:MAG: efflux RND transporter permease subunit [Bacteroidales bacterium]
MCKSSKTQRCLAHSYRYFDALEKNNENTGSAYIDKNPNAYFIRGIGLVKSLEDIEKIVVKTSSKGIPVLIRDIATVGYGKATLQGICC